MASPSNASTQIVGTVDVSSISVAGTSHAVSANGQTKQVETARFAPQELGVAVSPASIEVGISCGMPDMCGIDPCLCGTPDAYGACACNGLKTITPSVTYASSRPEVATVEKAFGKVWLVPHGKGKTTVTMTAKLKHYQTASVEVPVEVAGPKAADGLLAGAVLAALVGVVALGWGIRKLVSRGRRRSGRGAAACLMALLLATAAAGSLSACGGASVRVTEASPALSAGELSASSDASNAEASQAIKVVLRAERKLAATGDDEDVASDFSVKLNGKALDSDAIKLTVGVSGRDVTFTFSPGSKAADGPGAGGAYFAVYQGQFSIAAARDDGALPHLTDAKTGDTAVLRDAATGTLPSGARVELVSSDAGSSAAGTPATATFRLTSPARARAITWFSLDGGKTKILKHNHQFADDDAASYAQDLAAAMNKASENGTADATGGSYTARATGDTVTVRSNKVVDGQTIEPMVVEGFGVTGGTYTAEES